MLGCPFTSALLCPALGSLNHGARRAAHLWTHAQQHRPLRFVATIGANAMSAYTMSAYKRAVLGDYRTTHRALAQEVGLKWEDFTLTDNTCKAHTAPAGRAFFNPLKGVQQLEASLQKEVEGDLKSFGRGFTVLESGTHFSCFSFQIRLCCEL